MSSSTTAAATDTKSAEEDAKQHYDRLARKRKRMQVTSIHHQGGTMPTHNTATHPPILYLKNTFIFFISYFINILDKPECRVIIYNVAKKQNIGTIIRSAVAFGASQIGVIGARKVGTFGNQNTTRYIPVVVYEDLKACVESLREENFNIYGVEILAESKDVATFDFKGNSAFFMGNEGSGLSQNVIDVCDGFVYIPQYGHGTASLNVSTACAMILNHFARWANYTETGFEGQKFIVDSTKKVCTGPPITKSDNNSSSTSRSSSAQASGISGEASTEASTVTASIE